MAYTTIDKPSDYFNTKLYTGTGNSNAITGVGFSPNWVWLKSRSTTQNHILTDTVRGATKTIRSNTTDAENTEPQYLKSFDSDGFTLGTRSEPNGNGATFVSWNWKAEITSGLSGGSITPSGYSINTTAGFGIYKYTGNGTSGATIAHGLGAVPKVIFIKRLDNNDAMNMYNESLGNTKTLRVDRNDAPATSSSFYNNTSPTSSLITLGNESGFNGNNNTYVMYAFAEKQGYSKFSSYTGNGNANGAFIYTGFKPAFFLQKKSSASGNSWNTWGYTSLSGTNSIGRRLFPSTSGSESNQDSAPMSNFLSNGIKILQTDSDYNGSGATYIYMAFAENPFVTSTGVPATAR